jgi:adenine deaminase
MKRLRVFFGLLALSLMMVMPAVAADYDLVINNGRVMDPETMYDAVANVGIKDGQIAVITKDKITGKETIDAKGLVVASGFIDGHTHGIEPYLYRLMVRDGRTTVMDLEVGAHGPKLDEWYKRREGKAPLNFGAAVAHCWQHIYYVWC